MRFVSILVTALVALLLLNGGSSPVASAAGESWTAMTTAGAPSGRSTGTAVWTGTEMFVWGGEQAFGGSGILNSGGRYDPATDSWSTVTTTGAPSARRAASAVWTGQQVLVWGGVPNNSSPALNTGGRYSPGTDSWLPITTIGAPAGRTQHAAFWTGQEMLIWGGQLGNASVIPTNTGALYNPATNTWRPMTLTGAPAARMAFASVWTGTEMIVWSGAPTYYGPENAYLDGARYNPATDTWTSISVSGAPTASIGAIPAWTGSDLIIYGGVAKGLGTWVTTLHRYQPSTDSWSVGTSPSIPLSNGGAPIWTGAELLLWGQNSTGTANLGGRYHAATDSWVAMSQVDSPLPRFGQAAVWSGSGMLIWGGVNCVSTCQFLNTGGRYAPGDSPGGTPTPTLTLVPTQTSTPTPTVTPSPSSTLTPTPTLTPSPTPIPAGDAIIELRDSSGALLPNTGATLQYQPNSSGAFVQLGTGAIGVSGSEAVTVGAGTHRFRITFAGASLDKQQNVSANPTVTFQTVAARVELRDSVSALMLNVTATVKWQPGSAGGFVDFGPGVLGADGTRTVEVLPVTHRFRLGYLGASIDKQQNVGTNQTVVFQTTAASIQLRDSGGAPLFNAQATVDWQPGSAGAFVNLDDGLLPSDGVKVVEVLPVTHRFRLGHLGASIDKQQNVGTNPVVVFQTVSARVELRDSTGALILNSGATASWQPGSVGGFVPYGSGALPTQGVEAVEILPLTHRFRVTYQGTSLDKQQSVGTNPVIVFQTVPARIELRNSTGALITNAAATLQWQSGSVGAFVAFGDGQLGADGTRTVEALPVTHRFRIGYLGASIDKQQNVGTNPTVVFQTASVTVELRDAAQMLVPNSGAQTRYQPGSSGGFVNFGDGTLDPSGTEVMEVLPVTNRYRVTYHGHSVDRQSNATTVVYQLSEFP